MIVCILYLKLIISLPFVSIMFDIVTKNIVLLLLDNWKLIKIKLLPNDFRRWNYVFIPDAVVVFQTFI